MEDNIRPSKSAYNNSLAHRNAGKKGAPELPE
jgi:hypothetical protein